jgi:hypothetical protein
LEQLKKEKKEKQNLEPEIKDKIKEIKHIIKMIPVSALAKKEKKRIYRKLDDMGICWSQTKQLFDKYNSPNGIKELFKQIHNREAKNNITMQFMHGAIIFSLDKEDMQELQILSGVERGDQSMLGALEPKINIEGISIYPIVIGNNIENYEKVLAHELQHFINKFLINIW